MNGFKIGDIGYGFDEEIGFYSYKMTEDTENMNNLFKSRTEAIMNEIKITQEYLNELFEMLEKTDD